MSSAAYFIVLCLTAEKADWLSRHWLHYTDATKACWTPSQRCFCLPIRWRRQMQHAQIECKLATSSVSRFKCTSWTGLVNMVPYTRKGNLARRWWCSMSSLWELRQSIAWRPVKASAWVSTLISDAHILRISEVCKTNKSCETWINLVKLWWSHYCSLVWFSSFMCHDILIAWSLAKYDGKFFQNASTKLWLYVSTVVWTFGILIFRYW